MTVDPKDNRVSFDIASIELDAPSRSPSSPAPTYNSTCNSQKDYACTHGHIQNSPSASSTASSAPSTLSQATTVASPPKGPRYKWQYEKKPQNFSRKAAPSQTNNTGEQSQQQPHQHQRKQSQTTPNPRHVGFSFRLDSHANNGSNNGSNSNNNNSNSSNNGTTHQHYTRTYPAPYLLPRHQPQHSHPHLQPKQDPRETHCRGRSRAAILLPWILAAVFFAATIWFISIALGARFLAHLLPLSSSSSGGGGGGGGGGATLAAPASPGVATAPGAGSINIVINGLEVAAPGGSASLPPANARPTGVLSLGVDATAVDADASPTTGALARPRGADSGPAGAAEAVDELAAVTGASAPGGRRWQHQQTGAPVPTTLVAVRRMVP
ncbi:hypothetical protein BS50DRAFT_632795 [Corynespora cassiicola Philippines]|uniref:Uncharacterized protein n=1 Tax=Corynespora cassiicola Philippines TaxID=1448308 RepID=A0A2T2NU99_CORCC|nr:hypothetical protein BS50DRAFT_632795 [Corynespora cassiicola Philippines]